MTDENPKIDINIVQILNAAASILQTEFLTGSRAHAKQEFKKLKQGKTVKIATLDVGQLKSAPLKLQLDYSEYKGLGFGFDSFVATLKSMLRHTETAFKEKKDLNMLTNQKQSEVVLAALPGVVQRGEHINVMMMNFCFSQTPDIVLKLMFVDPGQFSMAGSATSWTTTSPTQPASHAARKNQ